MNIIYILVGILILVAVYAISLYNWLQTTLTRITASIQEVGNQLKRQASLIPNLEQSVKGYLKHEKSIFKDLTDARKAIDTATNTQNMTDINKASDSLQSLLPKLQVLVESNPELKGEKVISKLMEELRDTADKLMYSRRTIIDLTADFNQRLVTFPSNMLAKTMGFKKQAGLATPSQGEHLSVSTQETKTPKVSF